MRAVFVNHCHPETSHVCAVRAREFARAMAGRGHCILLLTETLRPDDEAEAPDTLARRIDAHDWSAPLHLACAPAGHPILRCQRAGGLPAALSKLAVAASYVRSGSVFPDWGEGASAYVPALSRAFSPDVVWANFGNTEGFRIAGRIATAADCPWVADIKDYWSTFIPRPFRRHLARLAADAAAMTALSSGHVEDVTPYFSRRLTDGATVIYSGVPSALLDNGTRAAADAARVLIVGALYDDRALGVLLSGIGIAGRESGIARTVEYAGDEGGRIRARAEATPGIAAFRDHGYIPLDRLHDLQRTAGANAFIRSGPAWFQHKVPELLAAGRPILCVPAADAETAALARAANVPFHGCDTAEEVARALVRDAGADVVPNADFLRGLCWDRRAEDLERALEAACR